MSDRVKHDARRRAIFDAVVAVLKEEEAAWEEARRAPGHTHENFGWAYGVRAAAEVAIGYLAVKRLMTRGGLDGYVAPEFSVQGGRIDLWVGDTKDAAGLGVELKYVMSGKEARTIPAQALRLCSSDRIDSAGFIVWGHERDGECKELSDVKLRTVGAGWKPWSCEERVQLNAWYREPSRCRVELWTTERL